MREDQTRKRVRVVRLGLQSTTLYSQISSSGNLCLSHCDNDVDSTDGALCCTSSWFL
jgi:hypothetical protein